MLGLILSACGDNAEQAPAAAAPPPAVSVVEVEPQNVTPSAQFTGRVVAIDTVDLRARVQGFLEQRLFTEGQDVKTGDLLYVIEQPPFQAQVDEAKAQLARAQASVAETKATLERVQEASTSGAVSKQELDQAKANDQRAQAEVLAAKAQLEIAQLNLSYTEIHAPIDGRIGFTNYTIGNLVGPDTGVLATIVSQDPIYVNFPVSTRQILNFRQRALESGQSEEVVVRVQLPDGGTYKHPGKVNFLNIEADQSTDTITVRAQFPNPDDLLVDGEFLNVTVESEKPEQRLVVPQPALQLDQAGSYVLIVNSQDEVEQRRVEIGQGFQGNVAVESGLKAGDKVIVEGIQKVRPGEKVAATVVEPSTTPPPKSSPESPSTSSPSTTGSSSASTSATGQDSGSGSGSDESAGTTDGSSSAASPSPASAAPSTDQTPAASSAPADAAPSADQTPAATTEGASAPADGGAASAAPSPTTSQ
jgi:membrane fusion protein (multidrug efflux system)